MNILRTILFFFLLLYKEAVDKIRALRGERL
jgi:hypothetical protein